MPGTQECRPLTTLDGLRPIAFSSLLRLLFAAWLVPVVVGLLAAIVTESRSFNFYLSWSVRAYMLLIFLLPIFMRALWRRVTDRLSESDEVLCLRCGRATQREGDWAECKRCTERVHADRAIDFWRRAYPEARRVATIPAVRSVLGDRERYRLLAPTAVMAGLLGLVALPFAALFPREFLWIPGILLGAAMLLGFCAYQVRPRAGRANEVRCLECGYSLQGLPSPRCPECGVITDLSGSSAPTSEEPVWLSERARLRWRYSLGVLSMLVMVFSLFMLAENRQSELWCQALLEEPPTYSGRRPFAHDIELYRRNRDEYQHLQGDIREGKRVWTVVILSAGVIYLAAWVQYFRAANAARARRDAFLRGEWT